MSVKATHCLLRQSTLHACLHGEEPAPATDAPEVYDLFCSCGGFSAGAALAGCRVVFACDVDADALAVHEVNHPSSAHFRLQLPVPREVLPFPTDGRRFHVHGSPPCTQFSTMRTKRDGDAPDATDAAAGLVEWYLETALASGASSWSMEQVPSPRVVAIVEAFRRRHHRRMAYGVFEMRDLGVPQTRRRLIAGSPALIARLRRTSSAARRRSVRSVLALPATAKYVQSSKRWAVKRLRHARKPGESKYLYVRGGPLDACHSVDGPAPTVVTTSPLRWMDADGRPLRQLRVEELAALQTFPSDYQFACSTQNRKQLLIGNAVPPLVATLLMREGR